MTRALLPTVCCVACLVVAGCQIFGQTPRCNPHNNDASGACAADEVCGLDGFCKKKPPLDACAVDTTPASGEVHFGTAANAGVAAMGDTLFARRAVLVGDAHGCNTVGRVGCGGNIDNPPANQPLGLIATETSDTLATRVSTTALRFPVPTPPFLLGSGFSVEAVFRTLPRAPAEPATVASMLSGPDGWSMTEEPDGSLALTVAKLRTTLAPQSDATWHHVLCSVDVPRIGKSDAVLCVVDGALAPPAQADGGLPGTFSGAAYALVLGGDTLPLAGFEFAVVRVWDSSFGELSSSAGTVDRQDRLIDAARGRLAAYLGVQVAAGVPVRFLRTNAGDAPRLQPVRNAGTNGFELVAGAWPRPTHANDGTRGILLEPERKNVSFDFTRCQGVVDDTLPSPSGRFDACRYDTLHALSPVQIRQDLSRAGDPNFSVGTTFVFSAFVHVEPGALLRLFMENVGSRVSPDDGACNVNFGADGTITREQPVDTDCVVTPAQFDGGWVKIVDRFVAADTSLTAHLQVRGAVWAPQIEIGTDETTPILGESRVADALILDLPGLTNATSTALRATVVTDGLDLAMSPVQVSADPDDTDRVAHLGIVSINGSTEPQLEITERNTTRTQGQGFNWHPGDHIHIGADLGQPIDSCVACASGPLGGTLQAPEQWQQPGIVGGGARGEPGILHIDADVKTRGTAPLPLGLDVTVATPAAGCLDGTRPTVSLVACPQGACSEDDVTWTGAPGAVIAGPAVDENAVSGRFEADLGAAAGTIGDLFFEVRMAPSGADGDLLTVTDSQGPVLRVRASGGDAVVENGEGDVGLTLPSAWATPGEWSQLTC